MHLAALRALIVSAAVSASAGGPALAQDFPQGKWLAEDIGGRGVADGIQTTIEIAGDRSVSGSGGCNRYHGKADVSDGGVSIGPLAATRMACPPAAMDQERKFFDALAQARGWKLDGGKLLLLDGLGTTLVRFSPIGSGASIVIPVPGVQAVETVQATYECGDGAVIEVEYFNAGPVSLATLSMKGEFVVMSSVLSGSGARYAGDRFIWWTKGDSGDLYDLTRSEDTPAVSCARKAG